MRSQDKTGDFFRCAWTFSGLLIDNVNIFLAVEEKVKEMAAQRDQTQEIQKCCYRLKDQLVVIYRVCSSPQLSCLNPADRSACAVRIDTSLEQMANLFEDLNRLDEEISKRDDSWSDWFTDRLQAMGLMEEPTWKRLHTNCIMALGELQQDVDAISSISIQNILEKVTEAHAILSGAVTQMGGGSRARGNRHRHSTSRPSGQNSVPEHYSSSSNSSHSPWTDHAQSTRGFDGEELVRRVRDHSTYLWDGYESLPKDADNEAADTDSEEPVKYRFVAKVAT